MGADPGLRQQQQHQQLLPPPGVAQRVRLCKACGVGPIQALVMPCRHSVLCAGCLTQIMTGPRRCTACQRGIEQIVEGSFTTDLDGFVGIDQYFPRAPLPQAREAGGSVARGSAQAQNLSVGDDSDVDLQDVDEVRPEAAQGRPAAGAGPMAPPTQPRQPPAAPTQVVAAAAVGPATPPVGGGGGAATEWMAQNLAAGAAHQAPDPGSLALYAAALAELVNGRALDSYDLVASALRTELPEDDPGGAVQVPTTWEEVEAVIARLGYVTGTADEWRRLGIARLCGECPSLADIGARVQPMDMLADLLARCGLPQEVMARVVDFQLQVRVAVDRCEHDHQQVVREREKVKGKALPLYRELGAAALEMLRARLDPPAVGGASNPDPVEILTQWSNIKGDQEFTEDRVRRARETAAKVEQGDAGVLQTLRGRRVAVWAPDHQATTRLLQALLRLPADARPTAIHFVALMDTFPGVTETRQILDLWWHTLLMPRWVTTVVRAVHLTPLPLEVVLDARAGPRAAMSGLAVFDVSFTLPQRGVMISLPHQSLAALPASSKVVIVDLPASRITEFHQVMARPGHRDAILRQHRRSPTSTEAQSRFRIDVLLPAGMPELQVVSIFQGIRRTERAGLGSEMFWARQSIYGDGEAKILEITKPDNLGRFWLLCTEMLLVTRSKVLVRTGAREDRWKTVMDELIRGDLGELAFRLKYKPSRNGGRAIATPADTEIAIAAGRRLAMAGERQAAQDFVADIIAVGEVGREDGEVLRYIMSHVCSATGLAIRESSYLAPPAVNEYVHLARTDTAAPPGRLRLYLSSLEEVRRVRAALHGQSVRVGADLVAFRVACDPLDAEGLRGPGRGAGRPQQRPPQQQPRQQ